MPLVSLDIPWKQKIFSGMKSFVEGLPLNCDFYPKIDILWFRTKENNYEARKVEFFFISSFNSINWNKLVTSTQRRFTIKQFCHFSNDVNLFIKDS